MTAPDLLPCPFCGGVAYLRDDVSHSTAYFIGCATDDCFGEIHWGQTEAEAIAGWNRREPNPAKIREAALREAIEAYPRGIGAIIALIKNEETTK